MRYYIIAGEASGDLHGSNLIKELKKRDTEAIIRCWGGDLMEAAGGTLVKHYRELAFMGFVEVLANLGTILGNLRFCKEDITLFAPDCLILIDYPGFNLRIAEWAHRKGLKVIYYISPQVWAWKENRVKKMKTCIDKMLVILPFEKAYYQQKWNWDVEYVGHPLAEVVEQFRTSGEKLLPAEISSDLPVIAILPGSRKQEILKKLPIMLEASRHFAGYQFVLGMAPGLDQSFYSTLLAGHPNVSAVSGRTYALLNTAVAALVTSGTATLETALFEVPEIVCYKGNPVSYLIARQVIRVKYISLVNLIMDKLVVKELIQQDLTVKNLVSELTVLLEKNAKREQMMQDFASLKNLLSKAGPASAKAADSIIAFLRH